MNSSSDRQCMQEWEETKIRDSYQSQQMDKTRNKTNKQTKSCICLGTVQKESEPPPNLVREGVGQKY